LLGQGRYCVLASNFDSILFILVLEESGYLPRAAFLLDKLMFKAGLSGRAFIPYYQALLVQYQALWQPVVLVIHVIALPRLWLHH
jgi:energy-converting hydrogenase Eha subunit H